MGKVRNTISGAYPDGTQAVITVCDGVYSKGGHYCVTDFGNSFSMTISKAIDALGTAGGVVNILPGNYVLDADIAIDKSSIVIRGSGPSTNIDTAGFSFIVADSTTPSDVTFTRIESARMNTNYSSQIILGSSTSLATSTVISDCIFEETLSNFPVYGDAKDGVLTDTASQLFLLDDGTGTDILESISGTAIVGAVSDAAMWNGLSYRTYPSSVAATTPLTVTGNAADSLNFDGTTARYVNTGTQYLPNDTTTPFSIEVWINVNAVQSGLDGGIVVQKGDITSNTTTVKGIVFKVEGNLLGANTDAYAITIAGDLSSGVSAAIAPIGSVTFGTWQHIIVTYDGSGSYNGVNIYIDGVAVPVTILGTMGAGGLITTGFNTVFGAGGNGTVGNINANIGLVSIWNGVALTAAEALYRYNKTNPTVTALNRVNDSGTIASGNIVNMADGLGI